MKFENKGKWVKQINESLSYKNEVRYINPDNLDRYNPDEIEEVTIASGEKRYKRKSGATSNQTVDKKEPEDKISQTLSYNDIPDRDKVNWLNVSTVDANSYNNTIHQLFNVDKRPNVNHAENLMRMQIYNGLDGELIKDVKERASQLQPDPNKEMIQTIKQLDDYTKNKQFDKAGKTYVKLWDMLHS